MKSSRNSDELDKLRAVQGSNNLKMPVIFPNGEIGAVPRDLLDDSIREQKIVAFLRSSGWVQIDRDPFRKSQRRSATSGEGNGDASRKQSPT